MPDGNENPWRSLTWVFVALSACAWLVFGAGATCRRVAMLERDRVLEQINGIPNVRVFDVHGYMNDPAIFWTVLGVRFSVDGTPGGMIYLRKPLPRELRTGSRLAIHEMGAQHVWVEYDGDDQWTKRPLDVGHDSELAAVLPFRFQSVQDLAARHAEVVKYIEEASSGTFTDAAGRVRTYRVRTMPRS
jgi:hypothetical protein